MSLVAATALRPEKAQVRRTAEFHPSVWGDFFIRNKSNDEKTISWNEEALTLKDEVRQMLTASTVKPSEKLRLIDAIQRLDVGCHFETEIEETLKQIYDQEDDEDDLDTISLKFRLLRQQGFKVSTDIFKRFLDGNGNFNEDLITDAQGMLSLYEASCLRVRGEQELDEAFAFARTHLTSKLNQLSSSLAAQVSHALRWPIRRGLPRKEARHYLTIYQQNSHNEALLKLAKLDFNIVQKFHQEELSDISKWWIDLDFTGRLPFARDRIIECSFWAFGVLTRPQYAFARRIITIVVALMSIVDDIYDVHGTIEELELFTEVVKRSNVNMKEELPEYMQLTFQALLDFYAEIEEKTTKEGRPFCIYYTKEAMKNQVQAYITEARWLNDNYVPTLEEYMSVATISSIYPLIAMIALCGMEDSASKEVFDWLLAGPKILDVASSLARLIDDMRSHEFEQSRGHVASAVECYMKQHGVSQKAAYEELNKIVEGLWKDLNKELLKPFDVPIPILQCILNLVRVMDVVYKDEDSYTNSKTTLKEILSALLVDPVPL